MGLKPTDRWVVGLCAQHHREQHDVGEDVFEKQYAIDLAALAVEFVRRSPHREKLS